MLAVSVGISLIQSALVTAQTTPATLPDLKLLTAGEVSSIAVQDDGKIIISGSFVSVNNVPRTNFARLNQDGTVDLTWNPPIDGTVNAIVASGTNVYLGVTIFFPIGLPLSRLVRVSMLDGSIDRNWGPQDDDVYIEAIAVHGLDVYVAGFFTSIGGLVRNNIAKLSASGRGDVDPNWNPDANGGVRGLVVSGDDVFAAGDFTTIGGQSRNGLAKLSGSGTGAADPIWDAIADGSVYDIAVGGTNLYVVGSFTNIGGIARHGLAKLSTLDSGTADWN